MELEVWGKIYREKFEVEEGEEEECMLALVKAGSFYLEMNGFRCNIGEKEAALFGPGQKFYRKVTEPLTMYLFRFKTKAIPIQHPKIIFKDKERINSTLRFLEQLDAGMYHNDFACRKSLFNDILTQHFLECNFHDSSQWDDDPLVSEAKKIFEQYLHEKTTLTDTARKIGISYVHFIRRFKQSTGITPSEYLSKIRLERAKIFLTQTNMAIKDIAPRCGYENEYYFSNVFKKFTSMTPSEFRKKISEI
ncbi:MAG: helix-turn-helix transcriptional regulator [Clostridia bacterium]|nr:helix-turn-helix transcriptional regulator [Clostridia bacterium]